MATFLSAGNRASYDAFVAKAGINEYDKDPPCHKNPEDPVQAMDATNQREIWNTPKEVDFGDDADPTKEDTRFDKERRVEREYLDLHVAADHLPFSRLQAMAKQGILPKRFLKCRSPICAGCLFGAQTRKQCNMSASQNDADPRIVS